MDNRQTNRISRARRLTAAVLVAMSLPMLLPATSQKTAPAAPAKKEQAIPEARPTIPQARRDGSKRVFLEKADKLLKEVSDTFMIVTGNVEFSHGDMLMYCDSAHFYPGTESLDAFGNVKMQQGDTLFVYADELNYFGDKHIAYLYGTPGEPVRMINRDVMLRTPTFIYDLWNEFGYYNEGGELTDRKNKLTSMEGEYIPASKEANFYVDVKLQSRSGEDTLMIFTDTLFYNTNTHVAELVSPSTIVNSQATITTDRGQYNTESEVANLYNRSKVVASTGTTLEGDTLFYDRNVGFGEAFGNMEIVDTANCMILTGDYGYYNELVDSAFATGHALAREYSQGDTLYLHAKYLYSFTRTDTTTFEADTIRGIDAYSVVDTTHVMVAHPRVRFYREDLQGVCDSMRFEQLDTMLYMFHHPIVWSGERQIYGNVIQVHLNDSTVDWARLPDFGLTAEHIEDVYYDQLAGKEMLALFEGGELHHLDVNGNVQAIMLPQEKDSTYNKIVNVESSFLAADFADRKVLKMKMWPETSGTVTPLYLARRSILHLPQFKWYESLRPLDPEDVMIVPAAMEALMSDIPASTVVPPRRVGAHGVPETVPPEEIQEETTEGDAETESEAVTEGEPTETAEAEEQVTDEQVSEEQVSEEEITEEQASDGQTSEEQVSEEEITEEEIIE